MSVLMPSNKYDVSLGENPLRFHKVIRLSVIWTNCVMNHLLVSGTCLDAFNGDKKRRQPNWHTALYGLLVSCWFNGATVTTSPHFFHTVCSNTNTVPRLSSVCLLIVAEIWNNNTCLPRRSRLSVLVGTVTKLLTFSHNLAFKCFAVLLTEAHSDHSEFCHLSTFDQNWKTRHDESLN